MKNAISTVLYGFIVLVVSANGSADYRLTVMRPGYGVNFDRVGHVVLDGGTSFYTHTWALRWPQIPTMSLPLFDCSLATAWGKRCSAINTYIRETNVFAYEMLSSSAQLLLQGKKLVPPSSKATLFHESVTIHPADIHKKYRGRRKKRQASQNPDVPSWLKKQTSDNINDFIPTHTTGQIWADLTNTPGPRAIKQLRQHIRDVGSAIYNNDEGIIHFDADISSFGKLTNKHLDDLVRAGNATNRRLQNIINGIHNTYKRFQSAEREMESRMTYIQQIDNEILSKVIPDVADYFRSVVNADIQAKLWMAGITTLNRGYISPFLIPENEVKDVLRHVSQVVLRRPLYSDLLLPSASPSYYYGLKEVAYAHVYNNENKTSMGAESTLYVSLSIPLHRTGGVVPVYRIDMYPVPTTAGTELKTSGNERLGFTLLKNLPEFIAVPETEETYIEMDKNLFLSCSGLAESKICSSGMPSLKKRRSGNVSCAFALFVENHGEVLRTCDFRYVNTDQWKPYGSAVQLTADSTFLMHASQRGPEKDKWTLSCPGSMLNPQSVVETCSMCRIAVPCFCSMSGADFYLPPRYTGCTINNGERTAEQVSYVYHFNTAMVKSLYPESDEAKLLSYMNFTKLQHPPFRMPNIRFVVEDNFTDYVDISNTFSAELSKTLRRQKKDLAVYSVKVDAALNRTRDFSDQIVDREGSITNALKDVFEGFFGGKLGSLLAMMFSPLGIALLAFILSSFDFIPDITTNCYLYFRNKKALHVYKYMLLKEDEDASCLNTFQVTTKTMNGRKYQRLSQ